MTSSWFRAVDEVEEIGRVLVDEVILPCGAKSDQRHLIELASNESRLETSRTVNQIMNDIMQQEAESGQLLLDREKQKSQSRRELQKVEEELQLYKSKNQNIDSEIQFLQGELEKLQNNQQELEALQQEVDEDTTEVIPSAMYIAQLYHKVTKIKWKYDSEPHILQGVHYGAELATPIRLDTSTRSPSDISNDLWAFVSTDWEKGAKTAGV